MDEDDMIGNIVSPDHDPTRGPQSRGRGRNDVRNEVSYTAPEVYRENNNNIGIRKFDAQNSLIFEDEQDNNDIDDRHKYIHGGDHSQQHQQKLGGPIQPNISKKVSQGSQITHLTPQQGPISLSPSNQVPNDLNLNDKNRKSHDHDHDHATMAFRGGPSDDETEEREDENDNNNDDDNMDENDKGSPEFGAAYKPDDYKEKNADDLDDELMAAFNSESSDEEESGSGSGSGSDDNEDEEEEEDDDQEGSVRIRDSTDNAEAATETDDDDEDDDNDENIENDQNDDNENENENDSKESPMLIQSDSRLAASTNGNQWEDEKKEMEKEIEDLKFQLEIAEQDLNEERETSGPLLKEVEMQKIRIVKLEEENAKLKKHGHLNKDISTTPVSQSGINLSPVISPSPSPNNENENESATPTITNDPKLKQDEEMTAKLAEFKKSVLNTPVSRNRSKRHMRSASFTSQSSLQSLHNGALSESNDDLIGNKDKENKGRFEGLKAQELIDAIYDRKVQLLNDQVLRMQQEMKKKDAKLAEFKTNAANNRGEIANLEKELSELRNQQISKKSNDISFYREQVRKLTQQNEQLKKRLQTAHDNLKSAELKKQDILDDYKAQRQITNNLQQKVQRVLQQNNTITSQVDSLHQILLKVNPANLGHDQMHSNKRHHNRHYSNSAAHNHLDTIRKCNMRGIQILHEIIEKNRRKRSDGYGLSKYTSGGSSGGNNIFGSNNNNNNNNNNNHNIYQKRKSHKVPKYSQFEEEEDQYNQSRSTLMNYSDDPHEDDYERNRSTHSTRFSKKRDKGSMNINANYGQVHNTYNHDPQQKFDFNQEHGQNGPPMAYQGAIDPSSTRSRGYGHHSQQQQQHHQQRSEQMMNNMQPLVLKPKAGSNQSHHNNGNNNGRLLAVDETKYGFNGNHGNNNGNNDGNGYNVRMKRVSYDYIDGSGMQQKYQQRKQKLHNNYHQNHNMNMYNNESFDEHEENEYDEESYYHHKQTTQRERANHSHSHNHNHQQQLNDHHEHNQHSLNIHDIGNNNNGDSMDEGNQDHNKYFDRWWIVKMPRRSSKVSLFGGNKGHKAKIIIQDNYLKFQCDATNDNLIIQIKSNDIKTHNISDQGKKHVHINTHQGKKYKIKCDLEKEATFWYNIISQFISTNN